MKQKEPTLAKKKNKYGPVNSYDDYNPQKDRDVAGGECVL